MPGERRELGDDPRDLRLTATGARRRHAGVRVARATRRRAADVRSDQFSFCVALFEALHGYKPFAGDDWPTLRASVRAGAIARQQRPPRAALARSHRRARLARAIRTQRWPSMRALLDALARGPLVTPLRAGVAAVRRRRDRVRD